MLRLLSSLFTLLITTALFTSCQRQQALFQSSATARYYTPQTSPEAPATTGTYEAVAVTTPVAPVPTTEAVRQVREQLDNALVSNRAELATNKVLAKRMARVQNMLVTAEKRVVTAQTATQKLTPTQRVMLKKLDTKIRQQAAPEKAQSMNRPTKTGLILIVAGLLVQFIPVINLLGFLAILAGLVFLLVGLIRS